jgi:RNA polymerase sigma factor (sigma-70 family)
LVPSVLLTDCCGQTASEDVVDLESDELMQEETMAATIDSALNVRGSNFSILPSLGNLHHRDAQAGHPEHRASFDELIAPHVQKIFRVAYRIIRNREDAEDAMQDALLQAFAHFEDFDGRSTFATWLTRIAINSSLMILRKRKYQRTVPLDGTVDSEESKAFQELRDPAPDAEQRYLQKEREATIRDAVKALGASLRSVVELRHFGERSIRETAEMIGLSVTGAKGRLFHARRALRKSGKLRKFRNGRRSREKSSVPAFRLNSQFKEGADHAQTI